MAEEYEKRHNALWPEMKEMIHKYGGRNYSIFLVCIIYICCYLYFFFLIVDLFLFLIRWDYMADIMETNPDNSPVCIDFLPVFYLE